MNKTRMILVLIPLFVASLLLSPALEVLADERLLPKQQAERDESEEREASLGENRGEVTEGGSEIWTYEGKVGDVLTIKAEADKPANDAEDRSGLLDMLLIVYAPDGTILAKADDIQPAVVTDSMIEGLQLPTDGTYQIEILGLEKQGSGAYTLTLEASSATPADPTPTPNPDWPTLTIENQLEDTICYVYISSISSDEFGDEWLGTKAVIVPNDSHQWRVPPDEYNIVLSGCYGNTLDVTRQFDVTQPSTLTVSPLATDGPAAQCAEGDRLFREGKPAEALPLLEAGFAARESATFAGPDDEGICALALGLLRDRIGSRSGALEAYQVALDIFQASGNRLFEGATLNNIGLVYDNQGQYALALEQYRLALVINREVGDRAGEGTTLHNIGEVYRAQGQYTLALEQYQQALLIAREVGDRAGEGTTLNNIGGVYDNQGQYALALEQYQQALEIHREVGDRAGEGTTLHNIGTIYRAQGQYALALEQYQQALLIAREVGNRAGEGTTLHNIGAVYDAQGQYALALEQYRLALEIHREVGDRVGEGATLNNIGGVYDNQGQYALALEQFQQALLIMREVGDRVGEGATLNNIGGVYDNQGQYALALEQYQQALEIHREVGDRVGEGATLNNIGLVYDNQGQYALALEQYQQALVIKREVGDRAGEGTTLHNIGAIYGAQGQYALALEQVQQALLIMREVGDRAGEGAALNNIGAVYDNQGQYSLALEQYRLALVISREVGNRAGEGRTANNIGLVYRAQGQYTLALEQHRLALLIMREVGNRAGEGVTLNNIGLVYGAQGQYALALEQFQQALEIHREVGNRADEGKTLHDIGRVYRVQGQHALALEQYKLALEISREVGDRAGEGTILNNIGTVYHNQGQYVLALEQYQQAIEIYREVSDRAGEGTTANNIGLVYDNQGEYALALEQYKLALLIMREVGDRAGEGTTLHNIGAVYHAQGQYTLALEQYRLALVIRREVRDRAGEGVTLSNIGIVYRQQGQAKEALDHYEQAMDVFEALRATAGGDQERASFIAQHAHIYHRAINLYHQQAQDEAAFLTSERGRARSFLDSLATGYVQLSDEELQELLVREREAYGTRWAAQDALIRAGAQNPPDAELVADLEAQLKTLDTEYSKVQADIEARDDELAGLVPGRRHVPTLAEVQGLLSEETTLISYWVLGNDGNDDTLAFILTPDELKVVPLGVGSQELTEQIKAFYQSFTDPFFDQVAPHSSLELQQLYESLIRPLKPHLNTPGVTIIPHRILHYLPFAALTDGERYFSDDYVLSTLPSASVLPAIQKNRKPDTTIESVLALGNPTFDEELAEQEGLILSDLPFAKQEVETLTNLFGSKVEALFGKDATESTLRQAGQANILHIAAHAIYNPSQPLSSVLFLAADPTNDGLLKVREAYGLDLTNTSLVLLSACETGLRSLNKENGDSVITDGDEIVALNRAFLFAGTPTVLSTLWSVDDASTALLMERFYTHLQAGYGKAEALRQAQIDLRFENPQYAHPYYWAGFVLSGDAGEITHFAPEATVTPSNEGTPSPVTPNEATPSPIATAPTEEEPDNGGNNPCLTGILPLALIALAGLGRQRKRRKASR